METEYKRAWIDVKNRILSFHPFDNGKAVEMPEEQFWVWAMEIIRSGYQVM